MRVVGVPGGGGANLTASGLPQKVRSHTAVGLGCLVAEVSAHTSPPGLHCAVQRRYVWGAPDYLKGRTYRFFAYASNAAGESPASAPYPYTTPKARNGLSCWVHCAVECNNSWRQVVHAGRLPPS